MRHAICYVSTAADELTFEETKDLLHETRDSNNKKNLKGILLYSEGNFFQVLEGEKKEVLKLYEKIKKDPRHYNIIQIVGKDIEQGSFDDYKVDVLTENKKIEVDIMKEYLESVKGMDRQVQQTAKGILEAFIDTR